MLTEVGDVQLKRERHRQAEADIRIKIEIETDWQRVNEWMNG